MRNLIFDLSTFVDTNSLQGSALNYFQEALEQKLKGTDYERVLKKRLKDDLISHLLNTEIPKINSYQKTHIDTIKKFSTSKILFWTQKKEASIQLAEEVLKTAMIYHMTEIVVSVAQNLQDYYSVINYDSRKYKRYTSILNEWSKANQSEILAQNHYTYIITKIKGNRTPAFIFNEAIPLIEELDKLRSQVHTYRFHFLFHLLNSLRYQVANDHEKTIQACQEALMHFNNLEVSLPYTTKFIFLSRQITPLIHSGQFDTAKKVLFDCLKLPAKGSFNWNVILQYLVFLGFHSDRVELSYSAFSKAKQTKWKFESKKVNEQWRIYKAYLVLFKKHNLLDIPENLRLYKFLNDVPLQSKDKGGFNVAILILQMLLLLRDRHFDKYAQKAESLRVYVNYHLRKDETYRIQVFMRLLLKVDSGKYRKATVERMTEGLLKKLQDFPLSQSRGALESEIVPFEKLWELVIKSLR